MSPNTTDQCYRLRRNSSLMSKPIISIGSARKSQPITETYSTKGTTGGAIAKQVTLFALCYQSGCVVCKQFQSMISSACSHACSTDRHWSANRVCNSIRPLVAPIQSERAERCVEIPVMIQYAADKTESSLAHNATWSSDNQSI